MTTVTGVSTEKRLTIVKHLASGKTPDVTAELVHLTRREIVDVASHHGYPSTELLTRAVGLLEKKIERDATPAEHPDAGRIAADEMRRQSSPPTREPASPLTQPDEIRVLINTAKGHPSKRIQAAGNRVIDAVDRLKTLIREDQDKHAEQRRQDQQRAAAKAEVDRLTKALADAKAKLKKAKPTPTTLDVDGSVTSAQLRVWARENDVECPPVGRVPSGVRAAYDEAHKDAS